MRKLFLRFSFCLVMVYLTGNTLNPSVAASQASDENEVHFCGVTDDFVTNQYSIQSHNRRYARTISSNLDVGEPRTVRMIYFLPNDRAYHAPTVQQMKDEIHKVQTFFAQQMEAHGYGFSTFAVETDPQGEPVVHRVDGDHPESHYLSDAKSTVVSETEREFNLDANIYLIVLDNSSGSIGRNAERIGGIAWRKGKHGGWAMVPAPFNEISAHVIAHELGHAFGLWHDFYNPFYIMSYGEKSQSRLSACHAEFLAVHPYFNPDVEAGEGSPSTIEFISPSTYPAGATSVSVRLKLSDPEGLHQVFLFKRTPFYEVWGCSGLAGKYDAIAEFDYDGYSAGWADWNYVIGLADFELHGLDIMAVDTDGNVSLETFELSETEGTQPRPQTLEIISGDNQQGRVNTQLAQPLVVEVRDQLNNPLPDAQVTFAVVAGEGRLNDRFTLETAMTDANGRAENRLTVGVGRTIVEVTIQDEGITRGLIQEEEITQRRAVFNATGIGAPTVSMMDGDYQRWHLPDGTAVRLGKGRLGESDRAVAFSPEGQLLAVASGIGVWLYDAATSRALALLPTTKRVHSVAFSTNGSKLAAGVVERVIMWDLAARAQIASLALPFSHGSIYLTSVSFSPDDETIAFMSHRDDAVKLWHVPTGNVTTLEEKSERESGGIILSESSTGTRIAPQSVSFSPDGRLLAAGSADGTVELWDVGTQRLLAALPGHRLRVYSVAFSRDGKTLASGSLDETVKLWDVMKRENIATLRGHRHRVNSVAFSPDGRTLASSAYGPRLYATIKLWDIASEQNIHAFATLQGGAQTVSFSTDGSILASGGEDGTVKLWDVETGNVEFAISGHSSVGKSVSFSPDGTTLASGSADGTVKLWDIATGRHVETFGPHALRVNAVAFSPDGTLLATGSDDQTTKLWDVATGTAVDSRYTYDCNGWVFSVAFSPDGRILATGDQQGLLLWNSATGEQISTPFGYASRVSSVAFSPNPDSSLIAFGSDFGVKLWDVAMHTPIASLGDAHRVDSVAFSPDGSRLAFAPGNQQQPMALWNVLTRKRIGTFAGSNYNSPVLSFSPDGAILASGGHDNTIKLWNVATQRQFATLEGHSGGISGITSLSFSEDMALASGSRDGTVLLWDLSELVLPGLEPVDGIIPDPNLRAAVSAALGVGSGASINPSEMAMLTQLDASEREISDLTGLKFATNLSSLTLGENSISDLFALAGLPNLTTLDLGNNSISDISAVAALTKLDYLFLSGNSISDISAVTALTNLTFLGLSHNSISDISAVAALTNLTFLGLSYNSISDISVVAALTNLTFLDLSKNSISDISAVAGLTKLELLRLQDNDISDISPLVANTGLGGGDTVDIRGNPLSHQSIHIYIPILQERGVTVEFDDQAQPALLTISGGNQRGLPGEALANPFVIEAQDENGSPFVGLPVTFYAAVGGGTLSTTRTSTDANGRAQSTLTLGPNPGTNTVKVRSVGIASVAVFSAKATVPIPISTTLSIVSGNNQTGVFGDTLMQPFIVKVHDESENPLEGVTVIFTVSAGGGALSHTIVDTSADGLAQSALTLGSDPGTNTVEVNVDGITGLAIFNAEAIEGIPDAKLRAAIATALGVESGERIHPLDMAELDYLEARESEISDLTGLEFATNLSTLFLEDNSISDLSALAGLTKLTSLALSNNSISDISAVARLTKLNDLHLSGNSISDVSAVSGLTNLNWLILGDNNISDISPLVANTGLAEEDNVYLSGNPLSYQSIQSHIPTLRNRGVTVHFENRVATTLLKISGVITASNNVLIVEVRDSTGSVFEGVPVTFTVTSGGGTLSVASTTTDEKGRAQSTLTLGANPGTNSVTVSANGIQEEQTFSAEGIRIPKTLAIVSGNDQEGLPGTALEQAFVVEVRDQFDKPLPEVQVTFSVSGGSGTLTASSVKTDSNGRAESILTLGPNPGTNSVTVSVTGIQEEQTFAAEGIRIPKTFAIVSGIDQEGLPGTALEQAFVVEVRDQIDKPLPEVQVAFSVTSGGGMLSVTSVTADNNGRAESILTLGPNPGTNSVTVSVTGIQEEQTFAAEGIRIPKTFAIVSGIDQEGLPGTALEQAFVVEVRDQFDKPLPEVQVTFSVSGGSGTLTASSVTTDSNGRAESILTLGPNPGTNSVTVSVTGIQEEQTFAAEGMRIPKTFAIVSGIDQEGPPGTALEQAFVVEVRDQFDKPLPEIQVTFSVTSGSGTLTASSVTTDSNGRAESILTLGPNPGTNSVTVSVTGIQEEQTFDAEGMRIPKTFAIVSGIDQEGPTGTALEKAFVVEVRGQFDKPLPEVQVTFSVSSGGGTLSVTSVTTDAKGRAESTLSLGPNPGTNTVTVSVTGIEEILTFTGEGIRVAKTLNVISGNNQQGQLGEALENPLIVEVRDQTDKPFVGAQVTFSVSSGGGTLSVTSATTDSDGRAESTLTLGPEPGTNTVTVTVAGIQEEQTFAAEGIRIPKTFAIVSGIDQEGLPGTALEQAFVVEVRDQFDKPLPEVQVTFSVSGGSGTLTASSVTTDSNGRAESILTLGPNPGTNSVTVSVTGIQEEQTFAAEGIRIPKTLAIVSGIDQEGPPGKALEKAFVVEVRDQFDKPLPEVQVTFSVSGGSGTLTASSVTTDSNGRAESILTLGPNPGTNSVTVSVTGIQEEQTFDAEGMPIPKTFAIVSGIDQEGPTGTALEKAFVVEVRDQTDEPFPGAQVKFAITSGGGTLSATSVTTDSNGRAESTLTLGPEPGTNTVTVSVAGIQEHQTFTAEGIRVPLAFWIISGDFQQGQPGAPLAQPFIVEVRDKSGGPLPGAKVIFSVSSGGGRLSVTSAATDADGRAESILTLGPNPGTNTVAVSVTGIQEAQTITAIAQSPPIPQDVNRDDVVNILDLVSVASNLGEEGADLPADVNGDGVVNILDLVLVAGALGNAAAAPSAESPTLSMPTATDVGEWLANARGVDLADTMSQRGVLYLEQLLAALTPKETILLPNYPNPFNPETWIPYRLAEDAFVTLTIYDGQGRVVRALEVGHRLAAAYEIRSKAIYWDGKNRMGEPVASGVYFYRLSAGDYSATRKMLILK